MCVAVSSSGTFQPPFSKVATCLFRLGKKACPVLIECATTCQHPYTALERMFHDRIRCAAEPPQGAPPEFDGGLYEAGTGPLPRNCFTSSELKPLADTWACSVLLGPLLLPDAIEFRCAPQALLAGVWEWLLLSCFGACDGFGIGEAVPDRFCCGVLDVLFTFPPRLDQTL